MSDLILARIEPETTSLLDCGCGDGSKTFLIKCSRKIDYVIGCDIWLSSLRLAKKVCDDVVLGDATKLPFREKSVEHVHAEEILEHLDKNMGYVFISEMERVAIKKISLTTPNGPTLGDPLLCKENIYQRHLSGWNYFELKKRGFNVRGTGFIISRNIPTPLLIVFSGISYMIPILGARLVAYRHVHPQSEHDEKKKTRSEPR